MGPSLRLTTVVVLCVLVGAGSATAGAIEVLAGAALPNPASSDVAVTATGRNVVAFAVPAGDGFAVAPDHDDQPGHQG